MLPLPPRRPLLLALLLAFLTLIIIAMLSSCSTRRTATHHTTTLDSIRTEQRTDTTHLTITETDITATTQTTLTRDSIVIEEWFYTTPPLSPFHQGDSVAAIPTHATVSSAIPTHATASAVSPSDHPSTLNYRRTTAILQSEINLTTQRELNRRLDSLVTAHAALLAHTRALEDSISTTSTTGKASLTPQQLAISRYANLLLVLLLILLISLCLYTLINRLK